ncbi:Rdx family-domain-containing protein [Paraphysoderma sedebokerense]|nr:Rdx family-domain-containing protein [Paraphysoderma sedebokerense]
MAAQVTPQGVLSDVRLPRISIEYCTGCRWMLRATWIMQELLTTFGNGLGEVAVKPGSNAVFIVRLNDEVIWDRSMEKRFPEVKELKQKIRDKCFPDMKLGHSDVKPNKAE